MFLIFYIDDYNFCFKWCFLLHYNYASVQPCYVVIHLLGVKVTVKHTETVKVAVTFGVCDSLYNV